ncbi:MAG: sulfatase-like hydrolase/transferase, partial [bacterium]
MKQFTLPSPDMVTTPSSDGPVANKRPTNSRNAVGLLRIALWFGLLGGMAQVAIAMLLRYGLGKYMHVSEHLVWSAPVAATITLAIPGALAWAVDQRWHSDRFRHIAIALLATLAVLGVAFYPRGIQLYSRIIVSLGIGVAIARLIDAHPTGFASLLKRTLPIAVAIVMVTAGVTTGWHLLEERSSIAQLPAPPDNSPNVLLLILDTVRSLDMSLYGYERATSPNIDRFAQGGVVFDRATSSAPWTLPSHASMFTGHPARDLSSDWRVPLNAEYPTLAERLRERGYLTAAFVGNLAYASRESGLDRGFAHYESFLVTVGNTMAADMVASNIIRSRF